MQHVRGADFIDCFLPLGSTTQQLPVALTGFDLTRHVAILGTVSGRAWEDCLIREQTKAGGGWACLDLWATPQRQNLFAQFLRDAGRASDLYVIDLAHSQRSDRWSPTTSGSVTEIVAKLMALCPPVTVGADRAALKELLTTLVTALRAAQVRFTLGDLAVLLRSPKALGELALSIPVGVERERFTQWLDLLANERGGAKAALRNLAERYVARLDTLADGNGARIFNTALPTIDVEQLIASGKCLYVTVDRHDMVSCLLARLLCLEITQIMARLQVTASPMPYLVFMGDVGRVVPVPAMLVEEATAANVGLIMTMAASEASTEGAEFTPTFLRQATSKIICDSNQSVLDAVTGFLGCTEQTSLLMYGENTMQLVVRPEVAYNATEALPVKHLPLPLAAGESILGYESRTDDLLIESPVDTPSVTRMEALALH